MKSFLLSVIDLYHIEDMTNTIIESDSLETVRDIYYRSVNIDNIGIKEFNTYWKEKKDVLYMDGDESFIVIKKLG